jgi:hypothetical protein
MKRNKMEKIHLKTAVLGRTGLSSVNKSQSPTS